MMAGLWDFANVETLYDLPFVVLVNMAQRVHRNQFDPTEVSVATQMPGDAAQSAIQVESVPSRVLDCIVELANRDPYPQAVTIALAPASAHLPPGHEHAVDPIDFVRAIAVSRVTMPQAWIGVSLEPLATEVQALCFMAGANTICLGEGPTSSYRSPALHQMESLARLGLRLRGPNRLHH